MISATTPLQTAGTVDMRAAHGKAVGQRLLKEMTAEQSRRRCRQWQRGFGKIVGRLDGPMAMPSA